MHIEFDSTKDALNRARHGQSLELANEMEWDDALVWVDERFQYDELRCSSLVPRRDKLFYVAFVDRDKSRRIISLRAATRKEVKHYVENFN